ncbi:hypothetical protein TYRP_022831 [Tyrophagus putrescentiae]|nr:hypothetical protein TYRP_022831 [Tyrophagus putrescentiae]
MTPLSLTQNHIIKSTSCNELILDGWEASYVPLLANLPDSRLLVTSNIKFPIFFGGQACLCVKKKEEDGDGKITGGGDMFDN